MGWEGDTSDAPKGCNVGPMSAEAFLEIDINHIVIDDNDCRWRWGAFGLLVQGNQGDTWYQTACKSLSQTQQYRAISLAVEGYNV